MAVNKRSEAFQRHNSNFKRSIAKVEKELRKKLDEIENVSETALEAAGRSILERSQQLVPVDTGTLKESAFIEVTSARRAKGDVTARLGSGPVVTIGYNRDDSAPYAVFVHERLDQYHVPPTQAKFLQTALQQRAGQIKAIIKRQMLRELEGR